jgi:hypothetical protein
MDVSELSKLAKPLPSTEVMVFKREEVGDVYLGKDFVAVFPKDKAMQVPTPMVDANKIQAEIKAELLKEVEAMRKAENDKHVAELAALKAENEKLKAPAAPKSDPAPAPTTPVKLSRDVHDHNRDIIAKTLWNMRPNKEAQ